jgi:hypothetical protein
VVASLLMVRFLDNAYGNQNGNIEPTAMSDSLQTMQGENASRVPAVQPPCDRRGAPSAGTVA